MTRVIGITGGMGSGKSTVSQVLAELGALVIDADKVGHETYLPGTETYQEIVKVFGHQIVATDNTIDRRKLGAIVFSNQNRLNELNAIVHPWMLEIIKSRINDYKRQHANVVILDAAILFEANWSSLVDEIWVVVAKEISAVKRAVKRTSLPEEQIRSRLRSQMSNEALIKRADVVIVNDSTVEELKAKVKELWRHLNINS